MRQITISVLSLFIALPVLADVRLPVVNIAAGGVSARAAFGEPVVEKVETQSKKSEIKVASDTTKKTNSEKVARNENANRSLVSRSTTTKTAQPVISMDEGEQIIASDILSPRRPSSDLWAHSSSDVTPLRLPSPQEFSVIRSDDLLPEESLDGSSQRFASARSAKTEPAVQSVEASKGLSELDAQIARLNELQRRAEESIETVKPSDNTLTRRVVSRGTVSRPTVVNDESKVPVAQEEDIKLSRMVVPMEDEISDDVVVRAVQRAESPRIVAARDEMTTQMTPSELRKAFRKTFLSENKHLSAFQIDDRFDVASDMTANAEGFTSERDLSETGGIRPLEIKIKFRNEDAALSRDNYNLLTEYAGIVLSNPTRAVQVSIPQSVTTDADDRKLAARRLAIIEQVLRDNGISEQRILPVLSQRDEEGLVLRMISLDQYETLTKQQRDIFGDTVSKKTYRSMSW